MSESEIRSAMGHCYFMRWKTRSIARGALMLQAAYKSWSVAAKLQAVTSTIDTLFSILYQ